MDPAAIVKVLEKLKARAIRYAGLPTNDDVSQLTQFLAAWVVVASAAGSSSSTSPAQQAVDAHPPRFPA